MRATSSPILRLLSIGVLMPGVGCCALPKPNSAPTLAPAATNSAVSPATVFVGSLPTGVTSYPVPATTASEPATMLIRASDATTPSAAVPSNATPVVDSALPSPLETVPETGLMSNTEILRIEAEKVAATAALAKQETRIEELGQTIAALQRELKGRDVKIESLEKTLDEAAKQGTAFIPPDKRKPVPVIAIPGVTAKQVGEEIRVSIPDAMLFQSDAAFKLQSSGEDILRKVVGELRINYPDSPLTIEGHTDDLSLNPQSPTYLLDISSYKAVVVAQYLAASLKIPSNRLRTAGIGAGVPVTNNADETARAGNRRVELVVR